MLLCNLSQEEIRHACHSVRGVCFYNQPEIVPIRNDHPICIPAKFKHSESARFPQQGGGGGLKYLLLIWGGAHQNKTQGPTKKQKHCKKQEGVGWEVSFARININIAVL